MKTTFSISNINENSPVFWKRFESAWLIAIVPGITGFIMSMSIPSDKKELITAGIVFASALVKGIGIFLGVDPIVTSTSTPEIKKPDDTK